LTLNLKTHGDGILFLAVIQPCSSKNKICGLQGESLKIRLTSPPVDGAANKMCIDLLAKQMDVNLSQISIVRGKKGRNKIIHIKEISPPIFLKKISQKIEN